MKASFKVQIRSMEGEKCADWRYVMEVDLTTFSDWL